MKMNRPARLSLPHAVAALALIAIVSGAIPARPLQARKTVSPPPPAPSSLFGVTLALDQQSYKVPKDQNTIKTMHATLTLFNLTKQPYTFAEHGQKYEWQVLNDQNQVVWDYAVGRAFPHNVRLRTLTNGHIDYPCDIPLQTQGGAPLPAGRYTLRGHLIGGPSAMAEIAFNVVE